MKRVSFIFTLLIFSGIIFSFYSCEKENLVLNTNIEDELFPENSEVIIDGELFIDGVSQKEVITDFDIEGVEVIDDRLAFVDHDAMMNAIHKLAEYNTESVVAWSEKIGFTSLFTELVRLEEKPLAKIEDELEKGMNKEYFHLIEGNELVLSKHSNVFAIIFNAKGILQVGEYAGVFYPGLNIWIHSSKMNKLLNALTNRYIPESDKDFLITDKSAFNNAKDWVELETCPKIGHWLGPIIQYKNPNARRRIRVQHEYIPIMSYAGNGLWDADVEYWIYSESRKRSWYKYKTNHYLSLDVRFRLISNSTSPPTPFGPEIVAILTGTANNTKNANLHVSARIIRGVTYSVLISNAVQLNRTISGSTNSGQTGTSASHQGMGGLYARQEC